MKILKLIALLLFTINISAQTYCPPIKEKSPIINPQQYSFPSVQKRTYVKEECNIPHPKYEGELILDQEPAEFAEKTKEVRINAILDGCYNIIEIISIDTVETGQTIVSNPVLKGDYYTIRMEYLKAPAINRPVGFKVSQLPDGNWITHYGQYNTIKDAGVEFDTIKKKYPQWCKMYIFKVPPIKMQGEYINPSFG